MSQGTTIPELTPNAHPPGVTSAAMSLNSPEDRRESGVRGSRIDAVTFRVHTTLFLVWALCCPAVCHECVVKELQQLHAIVALLSLRTSGSAWLPQVHSTRDLSGLLYVALGFRSTYRHRQRHCTLVMFSVVSFYFQAVTDDFHGQL